jgi:hypothetical protein
LLASATLERICFCLLVGRSERQKQVVFLNLRIGCLAFLRGHFLKDQMSESHFLFCLQLKDKPG